MFNKTSLGSANFRDGLEPRIVLAADVNGDGRDDLVDLDTATRGEREVSSDTIERDMPDAGLAAR